MEFYRRLIRHRNVFSVGDGNLSFTKKIVQMQAQFRDTNLIATSIYHDTPDMKKRKYLDRKAVPIHTSVDALKLPSELVTPYDTIIWCYPYPTPEDCRTPSELVHDFLHKMVHLDCNIIIGLKALRDDPHHQFSNWKLDTVLQTVPYRIVQSYSCKVFWEATHVTGKRLHKHKVPNWITYYLFTPNKIQ